MIGTVVVVVGVVVVEMRSESGGDRGYIWVKVS